MNLVQNFGVAVSIVFALSVLYYLLPARPLPAKEPKITIFPKYRFPIGDLDKFQNGLLREGFVEFSSGNYSRGTYFGDFSLRWAKMRVSLDTENMQATIGSGFMVIAFDTGDLWKLSKTLEAN